jgi:shikimate dehydrogenase
LNTLLYVPRRPPLAGDAHPGRPRLGKQGNTMREITGNTRLFGIVADPVHQVKTPQRLNELFAKIGYDGVCVPFHVGAGGLAALIGALRGVKNFGGMIATVPHKTAVLALADEAAPATRLIGAANVLSCEPGGRLRAHMLDGEGFVRGLESAGRRLQGQSVYLAGAGGAANAVAFSVIAAGAARLTLANRTAAKALDLKERLLQLHPQARIGIGTPDPSGHDVVINATSLGLAAGDALPLDASKLEPGQLVCEIIMQPADTALLRAAQARGCQIHYGAPMLACQIELMAQALGVLAAPREAQA